MGISEACPEPLGLCLGKTRWTVARMRVGKNRRDQIVQSEILSSMRDQPGTEQRQRLDQPLTPGEPFRLSVTPTRRNFTVGVAATH